MIISKRILDTNRLKEYLKNNEETAKILSDFDFDLILLKENAEGFYYSFIIENIKTKEILTFDYKEGKARERLTIYNKPTKIIECLHCIISDFYCFYIESEKDLICFIDIFYGSEFYKEGIKAFEQCKILSEKLLRILSISDIKKLYKNIEL